jgi:hypothetical protein
MPSDVDFYRGVRESNECLCGKAKKPGFLFCYGCNADLPEDIKKGLHWKKPDDESFASQFEACHKWLSEYVWD